MKQTPEIIWLKPDDEDNTYIVWTNCQMGNKNETAYVRMDFIDEFLNSNKSKDQNE